MALKPIVTACLALGLLFAPHPGDAHSKRFGEQRALIERSVELDIKVRNETLPLRKILELGPKFNGKRLHAVELDIKPRGRNSRFLLLGDGKTIGEAWSRRGDSFVIVEPYGRAMLGRDFRRLQLAIEGSARIERLAAQFEPERKRHRKTRHRGHRRNDWRHQYYFRWDHGPVRW